MRTGLCELVAAGMLIAAAGRANAQTGQARDRACLIGIADAYFTALAAHDPSKAAMAPNAKFTEQTQVLELGEGLWKTTTEGPTTFKIPVPDPVARTDRRHRDDQRRQDSRDRGHGVHAAALLEERLEPVPQMMVAAGK
jgi:hypothetical protein